MSREEGHLVESEHVTKLKARFHNLDERQKTIIREIADEAFGGISMDPPTERRVGIARILLVRIEQLETEFSAPFMKSVEPELPPIAPEAKPVRKKTAPKKVKK